LTLTKARVYYFRMEDVQATRPVVATSVTEKTEAQMPPRVEQQEDFLTHALTAMKDAEDARNAAIARLLANREVLEKRYKATLEQTHRQYREQNEKIEQGLHQLNYRVPLPAAVIVPQSGPKRFQNLKLPAVGQILLQECGELHGFDIERLAKEGGFTTTTKNFQSLLATSFKRAGIFKNIGGNTWRLL
jgi:hypothetical protein